jgi:hypothetical protein
MANSLTKICMREGQNESDSSQTVDNYDYGSASEHTNLDEKMEEELKLFGF